MKTAINTRTQEEYDALMRYYESKGIKWESGDEATENDYWEKCYKKSTCIVENHEGDGLSFANISYWTQEGYTVIPYTEFAKANIEPDYKALYLEGRELLEEACAGLAWYRTEYPEQVNESDEEFKQRVENFLTKHNDLTNHTDGE